MMLKVIKDLDGLTKIVMVPVKDAFTMKTERTEDGWKVTGTLKVPK